MSENWFLEINAKYKGQIGTHIHIYREYDDCVEPQIARESFIKALEDIGGIVKRVNIALFTVTFPVTPNARFWRDVPELTYQMEINPVQ